MSSLTAIEVLRMWGDGLWLGARLLPRQSLLGLKRLVLPVSYWRTAEFAFAHRHLNWLREGHLVLDVGSPKELAFSLARRYGVTVQATDILPKAINQAAAYGRALRGGLILAEHQDGRSLTYPANTFDAAYAVSVVEHIPGDGDSQALRELVRVVRPGGLVVITTPFAVEYRETFVARTVYDRIRTGDELVFYQRHYDRAALEQRLLSVPGASVMDLAIWGEGCVRFEPGMNRMGRARALISPVEAFLAFAGLREVRDPSNGHQMAVFFVLRKDRCDLGPGIGEPRHGLSVLPAAGSARSDLPTVNVPARW